MKQLRIYNITGGEYPIEVYISDVNLNNRSLIYTINTGPVPPTVYINTQIPEIFQGAESVILTLISNNNCIGIKKLDCTYCSYEIIITLI